MSDYSLSYKHSVDLSIIYQFCKEEYIVFWYLDRKEETCFPRNISSVNTNYIKIINAVFFNI